jgi:hypothetical protein
MKSAFGEVPFKHAAIAMLCLLSGMSPPASAGDGEVVRSGLWQLVETRRISSGEDEDPAFTDFAKRLPARNCVVAGAVVDHEPQMLQMMLQTRSRFNAIRSAADGRRSSLEFVITADPRWSARGPWLRGSFDRGWSSSTRSVTVITGPDRHEVETWSYHQSMRSGIPQGDPDFEHEVNVWERQGPCPPGTPAGPVIDIEAFEKALRDTILNRAGARPPPAVPAPSP